uniref:MFS domain-containing protein n=1 Tax=Macrostomum lignano TaxID=282301 RepID=A0A1I8H9H4_9PLAT
NLDIKVEDADQTAVESACGSSSSDESSIFVPFSFRALSRKRKLLLVSLCLGELCSNVMLSIMAPFFPSEAESKGVSSAMMKPAGVKFLFLSGAFLGGCATILFGALDHMPSRDGGLMFIIYCFAIRITTAWGFASYTTAAFVIIAQEFGDNVSQVFGIAETFCGIGAVLGPAVGGVLYGWGGFGLPFFVLGGIYLLTVPLSWPLIPSDAESHHGQVSNFTLLRVPGILMMCWTVIVLGTGWSIFEPVLEPRLGSYNLSPQLIGLVFLLTASSYALSAPLFGWITERIDDLNPLILASLAGCTACLAMLGPSPLFTNNAPDSATGSLALIIVSLALLGLFNSMGIVPSYEYMLDAA